MSKTRCVEAIRDEYREQRPAKSIECWHKSGDETVDRDGKSYYRTTVAPR